MMRVFPVLFLLLAVPALAREFSVVAYNVENLFDADGVAAYEDYQPATYTPKHLAVKINNIAEVLARVPGGPDIVALNEIELDQTPQSSIKNYETWLESVKDKKVADLIGDHAMPESSAGLPAEAWLLKALSDAGLKGYHVATTDEKPGTYADGRGVAVRNVILSRFPISSVRTHPTPNARAILEVVVDVDGHPLTIFSNHWKSGAGDIESEATRLENAKTLRTRIDEILASDANADILVTGDLNSHYNQKRRYRTMRTTGINDVLGAQGNELALRNKGTGLYNLWFELPSSNRGSDIYKHEWGTLLHIILSRGLYDQNGIQYSDNSFQVMKIPGLNADVYGRPIRWSRSKNPGGFSDHFPISARFHTVEDGDKSRWMALNKPSTTEADADAPIRVETSPVNLFDAAQNTTRLPPETDLRDGSHNGRVFFVEAPAYVDDRGIAHVIVRDQDYELFTHNKDLRATIRDRIRQEAHLSFHGELGTYRGRWQFVLHGREWLSEKIKDTRS